MRSFLHESAVTLMHENFLNYYQDGNNTNHYSKIKLSGLAKFTFR